MLVECIVEGAKLSLYKTNYNDDLQLFVLKDNQLYWLESGNKEFEIKSKIYIKEVFTYKGLLKVLMNDNPDLVSKVDKLTCTEKEVADLVIAYNEGNISYSKNKKAARKERTPDWKIYSTYSNYSGNLLLYDYPNFGNFGQIGTEYFLSEGSRHFFKLGLEYGKFFEKDNNDFTESFNLAINYNVDFYRSPNCNFYMDINLAHIGKYWDDTTSEFLVLPDLSPGIGFEYHISKQLDVFGEINNLLIIKNLPHDFLVGISFDL